MRKKLRIPFHTRRILDRNCQTPLLELTHDQHTSRPADLGEGALLDQVDLLRRRQLETGVQLLRLAAEFARQHGEATIDPVQARLPGRERAVRLGGEGTPLVAEFAPAVLAARMGLSAYAGARLVADTLDLEYRLPQLWTRVQALEVTEGHARFVARKTRHLTTEEAASVDARVAPSADGRVSWTRFETLVEAAIIAADPAAAAAREEAAAREVFAKATRSTEHGMRGFYVRADFASIARIDATVAYLARVLAAMGDTTNLDTRRAKAVLIMANPTQAVKILHAYNTWQRQPDPTDSGLDTSASRTTPERFDPTLAAELLDDTKLLPTVWLFAHLAHEPAGSTVGRVEGAEPVTADWVRRHLGERCRFKITPVLDPLDQVPVDAWEIPDRHRQAVHLLTPADTFPFAGNTTRAMQIDHTIAWTAKRAAGGEKQSRIGNYGPMIGLHHRIKTHGRWQVQQPFPGIYLWRDPHGAIYLVDHTGTRRLPRAAQPPRSHHSPLEAHLTDLVLAS